MAREILFEFTRIGSIIRVAAVDPDSLTEVIVQCPATCTQAQLEAAATARLAFVMKRGRPTRRSAWDGL
ncbi:hypothetical protein [Fodinicurvata sp. EGI_FJ10296]|uniref:DUF6898 family protein n=1 Tax=Fodinicurvata sp. EGI_FJ10296 TaxID=3231908 RepID=UPI003452E26C